MWRPQSRPLVIRLIISLGLDNNYMQFSLLKKIYKFATTQLILSSHASSHLFENTPIILTNTF